MVFDYLENMELHTLKWCLLWYVNSASISEKPILKFSISTVSKGSQCPEHLLPRTLSCAILRCYPMRSIEGFKCSSCFCFITYKRQKGQCAIRASGVIFGHSGEGFHDALAVTRCPIIPGQWILCFCFSKGNSC